MVQARWKRLGQGPSRLISNSTIWRPSRPSVPTGALRTLWEAVGVCRGAGRVAQEDLCDQRLPQNAGFSDAELDAMVEQQRDEFDSGKRRQQVRRSFCT